MAKKNSNMIGSWAFLIGVVLAVIFGLFGPLNTGATYLLILIGLLIGLLNISEVEVAPFLMAGTVLVVVSAFGQNFINNVPIYEQVLQSLVTLFVPATIIVALTYVFSLARK